MDRDQLLVSGLLVALAIAAVAIPASAATGSDELINDSVNVSDDTTEVWVEIEANDSIATSDNTTEVDVELTANGTLVESSTLTVDENSTETFAWNATDTSHDEIEILAIGDSAHVDSAEYGTLSDSGGAGISLDGSGEAGVLALVLLGGGVLWMRRD